MKLADKMKINELNQLQTEMRCMCERSLLMNLFDTSLLKMYSFDVWKVKKVIHSYFKASAKNANTYHTCYDSKKLQSSK